MSVKAPLALFVCDTSSITQPLDDGWANLEEPFCRPWRAMVLNLDLSDFVGTPSCLADLAYADAAGQPLAHAEALGQLLGLMTTLPAELKAGKTKDAPALSPTFTPDRGYPQQKVQLVLEPLRAPLEPFQIVGLRLHVLLYDIGTYKSFPTLSSNLWQRVLNTNEARRAREAARAVLPPTNPDPAAASRYVCSIATVSKMWNSLLGDRITGTKQTLRQWVQRHGSSVANETLAQAAVVLRMQLYLHRLSPEHILRFAAPTLLLRAPLEANAEQLDPTQYFQRGVSSAYTFPNPHDCLVYAGTTGAMRARFPAKLANEIMRSMEEFGGGGLSYAAASTPRDEIPARVRKRRHRDLENDSEENESGSEREE